jgi:tetratricopeptide (TPR) repeat protein
MLASRSGQRLTSATGYSAVRQSSISRIAMLRMTGRPKAPPRKTTRRWHLAPVITHGTEVLEGSRVLDEVESGLGVLLWQLLGAARLWAAASHPERGRLFAPGAEARLRRHLALVSEPQLRGPVDILISLVGDPAAAEEEEVARACQEIARWAVESKRFQTALSFSQASALAGPMSAVAALTVGRLSRSQQEHARAETWFRRTIAVARQSAEWTAYTDALLELGRLYAERKNQRVARRFFLRARRAAVRWSNTAAQGSALRELNAIGKSRTG